MGTSAGATTDLYDELAWIDGFTAWPVSTVTARIAAPASAATSQRPTGHPPPSTVDGASGTASAVMKA